MARAHRGGPRGPAERFLKGWASRSHSAHDARDNAWAVGQTQRPALPTVSGVHLHRIPAAPGNKVGVKMVPPSCRGSSRKMVCTTSDIIQFSEESGEWTEAFCDK